MKKPQPDAGSMHPKGRSIGSDGLTSHGQTELLKQLGGQMKADYAQVVNEPIPDDMRALLAKIDRHSGRPDEEDR
jgi:hypothetical protein